MLRGWHSGRCVSLLFSLFQVFLFSPHPAVFISLNFSICGVTRGELIPHWMLLFKTHAARNCAPFIYGLFLSKDEMKLVFLAPDSPLLDSSVLFKMCLLFPNILHVNVMHVLVITVLLRNYNNNINWAALLKHEIHNSWAVLGRKWRGKS
jgi:hypothetical protein